MFYTSRTDRQAAARGQYFSRLPLALVATGLVLLAACQPGGGDSGAAADGKGRPPVLVETWSARLSTVSDRVESIGTLAGNESVTITAKVTDQVHAVHFEDGQMAAAGDVLVELGDDEQTALLHEAQANLKEAQLQLQRLRKLGRDISTGASIDVADARVKASQARLRAIEARIADRLIRAPFAGQLGFREVSPGALVTPGTVITELDDISRMKLDFAVPETHLASIALGNRVEGRSPAYPDELFAGEVISVGSRVDPVTRAITVRALVNNSDLRLRPGMLMSVELISAEREVLVLPEEALIQVAGTSMVYLVDSEGRAERRSVVIGKRVRGGVIVFDGLVPGEQVVINGQFNLRPGSAVLLADGAG